MVQSSKVRPIDNYSESQVNDAATITNKCTVDGVDTIAAMASTFVKSLKESGRGGTIQGRAFDLKAAYRQLAVRDECLKWARVVTYDPHSKDVLPTVHHAFRCTCKRGGVPEVRTHVAMDQP